MVIRRGEDWGVAGTPPAGIPIAHSDREASRLIVAGRREFILTAGDMARTIGASLSTDDCTYRRLVVDLVEIDLVDPRGAQQTVHMFGHCTIRSPWIFGGPLRRQVTVVCNAQFVHSLDLSPKGHPNDGKIELLEFLRSLSIRDRLQVRVRARNGDHLPHPNIRFRQVSDVVALDVTGVVVVDGRRLGRHTVQRVKPCPDAAIVWVPVPAVNGFDPE